MSTLLPVGDDGVRVFKVPIVVTAQEDDGGIRICVVGPQGQMARTELCILILGQTGSGKTTFLNGIVNWLYGVEWTDDFRFKIITPEDEGLAAGVARNQSQSQTDIVSCYRFAYQTEFPIPNSVMVLDTPGFGDTRGITLDRRTVHRLEMLFKSQGRCGINTIDAVAFVVPSCLARLDGCQRYIFDSVLKIFGKDILDNMIVVATFADAGKPQVLQALKAAQVPDKHVCKFNNSALFAPTTGDNDAMDSAFWKIGVANYTLFFQVIRQLQPRSLTLTQQVLDERKKLQVTIEGLCRTVRDGVAKMNEIEQEREFIAQHQREIEANKNFKVKVTIQQETKVDLKPREHVTNCLVCHMTCHFPCYVPRDEDKAGCSAMRNGKCTVCPGRCLWSVHHNTPWRWELHEVQEERTHEELKAKYGDASAKKQSTEQMLESAEKQYLEIWERTHLQVQWARECVNRLRQIAARPTPLSEIEFVEMQIEGEKQRAEFGWQTRVVFLEEVLQAAKMMKSLVEESGTGLLPPQQVRPGPPPKPKSRFSIFS
jgi:hypothetical protein